MISDLDRAWDEGYARAVADLKAVHHGIAKGWRALAEVEARRWIVRGEKRTRATFGDPHPGDFRGRG